MRVPKPTCSPSANPMPATAAIEPRFRTVDGVRIRCAESGGSQDPVILLTSPWPESLYAFAPIWASLADHARLFAIDLPGFGASERREDLLSPRAMGGFLAQLIAEADLGTPHIVAPDVGTSAALFAAAAHPERIACVIVGTGGAAVPLQLGEPLASWVLDPDLDKYRIARPSKPSASRSRRCRRRTWRSCAGLWRRPNAATTRRRKLPELGAVLRVGRAEEWRHPDGWARDLHLTLTSARVLAPRNDCEGRSKGASRSRRRTSR
jgi:pimeloyl-ACP methyl ester carboxylesterase